MTETMNKDDTTHEGVEMKEFTIGELFDVIRSTKKVKDFSTSKVENEVHSLPALSSTVSNHSRGFYVNPSDHDILNGVYISITANGINSGEALLQSGDFAIAQDAYVMYEKTNKMSQMSALYIVTKLNKLFTPKYDYTNKAIWSRVSQDVITLPVDADGDPDWDFMTGYMRHIQEKQLEKIERNHRKQERILNRIYENDQSQSEIDRIIIKNYDGATREFTIGELFDVESTPSHDAKDVKESDEGTIPSPW